jgi:hypothetical protein
MYNVYIYLNKPIDPSNKFGNVIDNMLKENQFPSKDEFMTAVEDF